MADKLCCLFLHSFVSKSSPADHRSDMLWLLLLQQLQINAGARPEHLSSQRDHWEVIAVADFDHEAIRVMEEELIHIHTAFFYSCSNVLYSQLLQLLLHHPHAFALIRSHKHQILG